MEIINRQEHEKDGSVENENIGISSSTLAKMSKGETVSMSILEKICLELDCDFGDIISIDKVKFENNCIKSIFAGGA